MKGAFLCLPERQFFLERKKRKLLLMKGDSLFESPEAKSQPSVKEWPEQAEYLGDNGKMEGKGENSSGCKEA